MEMEKSSHRVGFAILCCLLVCVPFPLNIVLVATIPAILFALFIRIQLERFVTWWNSLLGKSQLEWNVGKAMDEYVALLEKKKRSNHPTTEQ